MRKAVLILSFGMMLPALASAEAPAQRKAGLWEIKMGSPSARGGAPMAMQYCVGPKDDALMQQHGPGARPQNCTNNQRRDGSKIIGESVCRHGGTTTTTRVVMTGDFSSSYHGDVTTTFDPPRRDSRETRSTIDARWLGACKPGQKPGDVIMPGMPGGMNMNDMMKNMPRQ